MSMDPSPAPVLSAQEVLEAAAYALVAERCRSSYLHELRGGLQGLAGAVELLARAAKNPGENSALPDKAVGLARRALQNHERALLDLVDQVAPGPQSAGDVNVGELLGDVLNFIRSDAANKSITFRLASATDVLLRAQAGKFRLLLLGLCCTLADGLPAGTVVDIAVTRQETNAVIEFRPAPAAASRSAGAGRPLYALLLDVARAWAAARGGSVDLPSGADSPGVLRICHPIAAPGGAGG